MVATGHEIFTENKSCQISLYQKKNFWGDCRLQSPHHSCCGVDSDVANYFCLKYMLSFRNIFSTLAMHYMRCCICYNYGKNRTRLYALSTLEPGIKLLEVMPIRGYLYWINFNNTIPHREETSVPHINKPEPGLVAGYGWFQVHIPSLWD